MIVELEPAAGGTNVPPGLIGVPTAHVCRAQKPRAQERRKGYGRSNAKLIHHKSLRSERSDHHIHVISAFN